MPCKSDPREALYPNEKPLNSKERWIGGYPGLFDNWASCPTQGVIAYALRLGKSNLAMELFSEGDLAGTFIPAIHPTAWWFPLYNFRFCSSFCRSASENRNSEWITPANGRYSSDWQGTVFPHVEYLEMERPCYEWDKIQSYWFAKIVYFQHAINSQ